MYEVWLRPLVAGGIDGPTLTGLSFHNMLVLVAAACEGSKRISSIGSSRDGELCRETHHLHCLLLSEKRLQTFCVNEWLPPTERMQEAQNTAS